MLSEKDDPSAVVWTVRRWCLDCAAGPEESSTSEVQRSQKFCRRKVLLSVRGTTQVGTSTDRSCRVLSDTRQQSSAKYRGACPDSDWQTRHATLNLTVTVWQRQLTDGRMTSLVKPVGKQTQTMTEWLQMRVGRWTSKSNTAVHAESAHVLVVYAVS